MTKTTNPTNLRERAAALRLHGLLAHWNELADAPWVAQLIDWEEAERALIQALKRKYLNYTINEGDGAFYGPKIDIKLKDALKREWQCATIQCDFALPERFNLTYVGQDGKEYRPIMLHRVILGSLERFMGALIEHFAGAMPLWLAPVQCAIIPISDKAMEYEKK